jgi:hypothetical protein
MCCGTKRRALDPTKRTLASPIGPVRMAPRAVPAPSAPTSYRQTTTPKKEMHPDGR